MYIKYSRMTDSFYKLTIWNMRFSFSSGKVLNMMVPSLKTKSTVPSAAFDIWKKTLNKEEMQIRQIVIS